MKNQIEEMNKQCNEEITTPILKLSRTKQSNNIQKESINPIKSRRSNSQSSSDPEFSRLLTDVINEAFNPNKMDYVDVNNYDDNNFVEAIKKEEDNDFRGIMFIGNDSSDSDDNKSKRSRKLNHVYHPQARDSGSIHPHNIDKRFSQSEQKNGGAVEYDSFNKEVMYSNNNVNNNMASNSNMTSKINMFDSLNNNSRIDNNNHQNNFANKNNFKNIKINSPIIPYDNYNNVNHINNIKNKECNNNNYLQPNYSYNNNRNKSSYNTNNSNPEACVLLNNKENTNSFNNNNSINNQRDKIIFLSATNSNININNNMSPHYNNNSESIKKPSNSIFVNNYDDNNDWINNNTSMNSNSMNNKINNYNENYMNLPDKGIIINTPNYNSKNNSSYHNSINSNFRNDGNINYTSNHSSSNRVFNAKNYINSRDNVNNVNKMSNFNTQNNYNNKFNNNSINDNSSDLSSNYNSPQIGNFNNANTIKMKPTSMFNNAFNSPATNSNNNHQGFNNINSNYSNTNVHPNRKRLFMNPNQVGHGLFNSPKINNTGNYNANVNTNTNVNNYSNIRNNVGNNNNFDMNYYNNNDDNDYDMNNDLDNAYENMNSRTSNMQDQMNNYNNESNNNYNNYNNSNNNYKNNNYDHPNNSNSEIFYNNMNCLDNSPSIQSTNSYYLNNNNINNNNLNSKMNNNVNNNNINNNMNMMNNKFNNMNLNSNNNNYSSNMNNSFSFNKNNMNNFNNMKNNNQFLGNSLTPNMNRNNNNNCNNNVMINNRKDIDSSNFEHKMMVNKNKINSPYCNMQSDNMYNNKQIFNNSSNQNYNRVQDSYDNIDSQSQYDYQDNMNQSHNIDSFPGNRNRKSSKFLTSNKENYNNMNNMNSMNIMNKMNHHSFPMNNAFSNNNIYNINSNSNFNYEKSLSCVNNKNNKNIINENTSTMFKKDEIDEAFEKMKPSKTKIKKLAPENKYFEGKSEENSNNTMNKSNSGYTQELIHLENNSLINTVCNKKQHPKILKALNSISNADLSKLLKKCLKSILEIIQNKNGSIFFQKMLEKLDVNQRQKAIETLEKNLFFCCVDKFANRTIQALISTVKRIEEEIQITNLLTPKFEVLSIHNVGVYVLIEVLNTFSLKGCEALCFFIESNLVYLLTNCDGLILVKKYITKLKKENLTVKKNFLNKIASNFSIIAKDKFGHYGLNFLIDEFGIHFCQDFCNILLKDIDNFMIKSYSYKIIKKFMRSGNETLRNKLSYNVLHQIKSLDKIVKIKQGMKIIRLAVSLLDESTKEKYFEEINKKTDISESTKDQILKISSKLNDDDDEYPKSKNSSFSQAKDINLDDEDFNYVDYQISLMINNL